MYKCNEKISFKAVTLEDPREQSSVFLDPNELSTDGTAHLGSFEWSENGKYMAYQINRGGSDWSTIYVRDADSGKDLGEELKWVKFSGVSWTKDNLGFYYSRFDAPESIANSTDANKAGQETDKLKFHQVFYHRVGTAQSEDVKVYEDKNEPDWMFDCSVTHDGKYLMLSTRKDCDDIELLSIAELADPSSQNKGLIEFTPLIKDWFGGFSYIHNIGSKFYFKTNFKAPRSRVICIDLAKPEQEAWTEVIPEHG